MRGEPTFVDTNVLVYAYDRDAGGRHDVAGELLAELWTSRTGVLSTQVLQEFYVTTTRKLPSPLDRTTARGVLAVYQAWPVHEITPADVIAAGEIEETRQLSFWDGLIVQCAIRLGATRLLTEDLQAGHRIAGVTIENPFA